MSNELYHIDGDELCTILENEQSFYIKWSALAEQFIVSLFDIRSEGYGQYTVAYFWRLNGLSFSRQEVSNARMGDLVHQFSRQLKRENDDYAIDYNAEQDAVQYFTQKALRMVRSGEITLPVDIHTKLAMIYMQGAKVNVAKATRDLDMTRHIVNKLMDAYSFEMFTRYNRVQKGESYTIVMGDCAPYIQNCPAFTPVERVDVDNRSTYQFNEGDFVADWGSSRWYEVGPLNSSGHCIFTRKVEGCDSPILSSRHIRVLPKRYRDVAHKFCGTIHGMPAHQYLAQVN